MNEPLCCRIAVRYRQVLKTEFCRDVIAYRLYYARILLLECSIMEGIEERCTRSCTLVRVNKMWGKCLTNFLQIRNICYDLSQLFANLCL
jgi:hypothetical protein